MYSRLRIHKYLGLIKIKNENYIKIACSRLNCYIIWQIRWTFTLPRSTIEVYYYTSYFFQFNKLLYKLYVNNKRLLCSEILKKNIMLSYFREKHSANRGKFFMNIMITAVVYIVYIYIVHYNNFYIRHYYSKLSSCICFNHVEYIYYVYAICIMILFLLLIN